MYFLISLYLFSFSPISEPGNRIAIYQYVTNIQIKFEGKILPHIQNFKCPNLFKPFKINISIQIGVPSNEETQFFVHFHFIYFFTKMQIMKKNCYNCSFQQLLCPLCKISSHLLLLINTHNFINLFRNSKNLQTHISVNS